MKGISKSDSKNIKFDEYKKCLNAEEYQKEHDNYVTRSVIHELYLQLVQKSTLSLFVDKRCYTKIMKVNLGISIIKWL